MVTDHADNRWRIGLAAVCGLLVAGLGVFALLGWILNIPGWPSLWSDTTPMAPSTALLFAVIGVAVAARARWPQGGRLEKWAIPVGLLATLAGLGLAVTSSMGIFLQAEHLGIPILSTPAEIPVGHMSPLTAILFAAGGVSFLTSLHWPTSGRRLARVSWWVGCVLLAAGLALILAYLFGVEQLAVIAHPPPAALTSMSMFLLGIGLLALAGLADRGTDAPSGRPETSFGVFLMIFGLLTVGIVTIAYLSYRNHEDRYREGIESQLQAVWQLKADELVNWRDERLGDAQVLYRNTAFSTLVQHFLDESEDKESRRQLTAWLTKYPEAFGYERVFLLDSGGIERLAVPETGEPLASHVIQDAAQGAGEITFLDFHRDEPSGHVHLALLVPILDPQEGSQPLGTLVMRIDPQTYLYPFLQQWPTPSETAETLLVRREGEQVVFLSELRFERATALSLRSPLSQADLPAAAAARGEIGIMEGVDYRGVPTLARVGTVPDSPWALVARMDLAEATAPMRTRLRETIGIVAALVFGAAAGMGLFWRQERMQYHQARYRAAEALRESEDKFRHVFDYSVTGTSITLPSGEINVNRAMGEMLGYSQEELKNRKWQDITHPDDLELTQRMVDSLLSGERDSVRFTKRYLHKNGSIVWAEVGTALRRNQDGEPLYFMTSLSDITERKRAEGELQVLSSRYQAILAAVPDIIAEVDENRVYTWVNRAGLEFFGEGVVGKEAGFYFEGEQDTYALVQPLFDGTEEAFYVESWQRRQDGQRRLLGWWCRVLKDAEGNVTGALSTARDITERSLADTRLRESEARYRTLVEYSPIAILVNRADRIVLANKACLELFGATEPGQLTGRSPYELFHPESHSTLRERIQELHDHGRAVPPREEKIIRLDGAVVDVEVTAAPFEDQGGTSIHVVMRDITERKRLENRLLTLNAELELGVAARTTQLEAANKELEAFAYSVSHDLRAPLRAMHGFSAALLSGSRDQLDEQGRHYLDRIGVAAKHMGDLIDALLDLARISRAEMSHQPVDLSGLAREIAAELQTQDPQRLVEWVIADKLPTRGDARLLSVALQNLLGNAWKFTALRPQARIEVGALPRTIPTSAPASGGEEEGLVYFVRDNGVGFDMLYADRLFAPFQRLHGMREFPGTGIGLATVQRIIARHGGRVWAEAEVDRGATFYFTLESA